MDRVIIRPIHSDEDHAAAVRTIDMLWGAEESSREAEILDVLATLVDAYERKRWPVDDADPVEILKYAIEEMGHNQSALAEIVGSRSRASEILRRKRALTVDMIDKIANAWGIPHALLAKPYALVKKPAFA